MKKYSLRLLVLVCLVLTYFGALSLYGRFKKLEVGLDANGHFFPCPPKPNCVSSQSSDLQHQIDPFKETSLEKVKEAVLKLPRTHIVLETPNYLHATFTSGLLRYIDDVEFASKDSTVHVKSASRVGHSDLGANRKRVEEIRSALVR